MTKEIDFETEISINKKKKKIVLCERCALPFIKIVGSHPPLSELLSYIGETKESFFEPQIMIKSDTKEK